VQRKVKGKEEEKGWKDVAMQNGGQRERCGCYQIGKSKTHIHGRGRTLGALIQKYWIFLSRVDCEYDPQYNIYNINNSNCNFLIIKN